MMRILRKRRFGTTVIATCTAVVLGAIGAVGCGATSATATGSVSPTKTTASTPRHAAATSATHGIALTALAALPVKGRAPMTGYSRDRFGDGWLTVNGCDTRDRILRRDLSRKAFSAGGTCEVLSGHLNDPYTARPITFVRGGGSEVDIDHVVALGDAWQKGAQQWSPSRRIALANDPLNLLSVDAGANRQKGDGDAATWLPPNKSFRCRYVARQIAVKRRYGAWVTRAERDAMRRVLAKCPATPLPAGGGVHVPTASPTPSAPASSAHVYANCAAVRAAGVAPLRRGTPAYEANQRLDRDKDGLACE
jgi:uncharacterized protein DUF1524/excalibur calcium-binding domain-containing protein